jgi:hypothetical protein
MLAPSIRGKVTTSQRQGKDTPQYSQMMRKSPSKKASSKPMLFPYQRHNMSRPGHLGDFLPCDLANLLHGYYTVDGLKQSKKLPKVTYPLLQF